MPDLYVSARLHVPARWQSTLRVEAHLVLAEALLYLPAGTGTVPLRAPEDAQVEALAQAVAEAPLAKGRFGESPTRDLDELARLVAAVSKLDVYVDVVEFVSAARWLRRAVDHVGATRVVWFAEDPSLARAVTTLLHVNAHVVRVAAAGPSDGRFGALIRWLKYRRLEWTMRGLTSLADAFTRRQVAGCRPVLSVFDVRNDGMIANVARVTEGLTDAGIPCAAVHMDRRVGAAVARLVPKAPRVPLVAHARVGDLAWAGSRTSNVRRRLVRRWASPAATDPDVEAAMSFATRRLNGPYVWQTLLDAVASERLLAGSDPAAVVVASDAHRYARLLVLLAGSKGIPTAVVQHGALVLRDFYLPVVADRMFAWGPWCAAWFVANGTVAGRVHDAGFVRAPSRRSLRATAPDGARWLFAAQPIPDAITASLLHTVRVALTAHPTAHLVVRPHPGESRRAVLSRLVRTWPPELRSRVSISPPGRPLDEDLAVADVCIISQSTVGIDALASGVPVVLLEHPDVPKPIPFAEFGAVLVAGDGDGLATAVRRLGDPGAVADLGRRAGSFLDAYVGRTGDDAVRQIVGNLASWARSGRRASGPADVGRTQQPADR